ncbi:MAG: hypothetical protein ACI4TJ_00520 [Candidatus Cryptobacteroides sp.]
MEKLYIFVKKHPFIRLSYAISTYPDRPSWLAWIHDGYTSLGETLTMSPRFNDASSLNHIFFGDISAWLAWPSATS